MTQPNTPMPAVPMQAAPEQAVPKYELSRSLKGRHLTMISIGGIIGAGLFVSSSTSIIAGGPASFISYAICGLLILLVMRMLGEMTTALPQCPLIHRIRARRAWARARASWSAGCIGTSGCWWCRWKPSPGAKILQHWLPNFSPLQIGVGLMTVMTGVNLMSARSYAEFEFWFASIKVAAIIVFIVIAASFAFGWTSPHGSTFGNLVDYGGFTPNGWIAVLAAVPTVFFAMTGAEITTIAAAESAQPGRAVARMSTQVIWRILIFYVISLFLIVSVTPWNTVRLRRIAVHSGAQHHACAVGAQHHERHHSHRRAVLPEFGVLCEFAGDVHPRRSRRCAPGAGQTQCPARAGGLGDDGRGGRLSRHHRRHRRRRKWSSIFWSAPRAPSSSSST